MSSIMPQMMSIMPNDIVILKSTNEKHTVVGVNRDTGRVMLSLDPLVVVDAGECYLIESHYPERPQPVEVIGKLLNGGVDLKGFIDVRSALFHGIL